jgi:multicomponent Na+:H+ antiporter subunit G
MIEVWYWLTMLIAAAALLSGAFFSIVGGWGIVRFPEFYSRLHSGGVTDTAGAGLILVGLMIQTGWNLASAKLLMVLFFFILTSPSACNALAKSALNSGLKPELDANGQKV